MLQLYAAWLLQLMLVKTLKLKLNLDHLSLEEQGQLKDLVCAYVVGDRCLG